MNITQRDRDLGTAYAMKPSTSRTELTQVSAAVTTALGALLFVWAAQSICADIKRAA
jgi:hypothetical protein